MTSQLCSFRETEANSKRSLEVQVRTELVSNTSNDSTIFVGLAAQVCFGIRNSKRKYKSEFFKEQ